MPKPKLSQEQIEQIRASDKSNADLAIEFNVDPSAISRACSGKSFSSRSAAAPVAEVRPLPMHLVMPDADQPRKEFSEAELRELAASIRETGLLQPIVVRPGGGGTHIIVAGERRYRAHLLLNAETILARVVEMTAEEVGVAQIVENYSRVNISPLEEAAAYQRMLDKTGWSVETLAAKLGIKQPWRITERTSLLRLKPEYTDLLSKGHLTASQAFEMSRQSPRAQDALFRSIKAGRCQSYNDLRAASDALIQADSQQSIFGNNSELPQGPTEEERRAAASFEQKVGTVARLLQSGIRENEIVAVRKVDPTRAGTLADMLAAMQRDMRRIEVALRQAAVQADLAAAA